MGLDRRLEIGDVDTSLGQNSTSQPVLLKKSEQQMLRFKVLMFGALRQLLGGDDGGPGLFCELFRRGLHL